MKRKIDDKDVPDQWAAEKIQPKEKEKMKRKVKDAEKRKVNERGAVSKFQTERDELNPKKTDRKLVEQYAKEFIDDVAEDDDDGEHEPNDVPELKDKPKKNIGKDKLEEPKAVYVEKSTKTKLKDKESAKDVSDGKVKVGESKEKPKKNIGRDKLDEPNVEKSKSKDQDGKAKVSESKEKSKKKLDDEPTGKKKVTSTSYIVRKSCAKTGGEVFTKKSEAVKYMSKEINDNGKMCILRQHTSKKTGKTTEGHKKKSIDENVESTFDKKKKIALQRIEADKARYEKLYRMKKKDGTLGWNFIEVMKIKL